MLSLTVTTHNANETFNFEESIHSESAVKNYIVYSDNRKYSNLKECIDQLFKSIIENNEQHNLEICKAAFAIAQEAVSFKSNQNNSLNPYKQLYLYTSVFEIIGHAKLQQKITAIYEENESLLKESCEDMKRKKLDLPKALKAGWNLAIGRIESEQPSSHTS